MGKVDRCILCLNTLHLPYYHRCTISSANKIPTREGYQHPSGLRADMQAPQMPVLKFFYNLYKQVVNNYKYNFLCRRSPMVAV